MLTTTLGGGFTSRLNQKLREQLGITYGIAPGRTGGSRAVRSRSRARSSRAETAHGLTETIKIVDDLAATDVPAAELDKSKQNLIRALPAQFETNAATAGAFAELALHGLPDDWYAHYADADPQGHREGRAGGREGDDPVEARWCSRSSATWRRSAPTSTSSASASPSSATSTACRSVTTNK